MRFPTTPFAFLFYFVRKQWIKFSLLVFTAMTWALNDTFFPYFIKRIVNVLQHYHGTTAGMYAALSGTLIFLVIFWLTNAVLSRVQGVLAIYVFPKFRAQIRDTVFRYVKQHSHDYFSNQFAGNIAKKLSDLPTSSESMLEMMCYQFTTVITGAIIVFVMMWMIQPIFALITLVWLCLHMSFTVLCLKYTGPLWEVHSESVSTLSGKIVDVLTNILNVRLFAHSRYEEEYLKKFQQDEMNKSKKVTWVMECARIGLEISGLFLIFAQLFMLLHVYGQGRINLGDFTQVGMQAFWLLGFMWFVSYQILVFSREKGTIENALRLVSKGHDVIDLPHAKALQIHRGMIQFEQVCFSYSENKKLFEQLTLTIPAGKKIGLVGFSGSGKSTFVNLILRFHDLQSGAILIDGQNIAEVTQDSLRAQIAMIPQDPMLFHRTLMENIRYGRLDASDEEVIAASKAACCHEFIVTLDEGYQSLVGERGVKLSGGQRQRIAIARAILKNAPILILDEATSALDSVTEKLIQQSLQQLMQRCTTIVIAHRLSTLAHMDEILVFDKGKIIESGTQASLLAQEGHFAKLWTMQANGFLPEKQ
jgi:ATP-binding cassette subfamily B protein